MVEEVEPAAVSAGRRAGKGAVGSKIATGNRLRDGVVVYFDPQGGWTTEVSQARIARTPDEEAALQAALDAAVKGNFLIDAAVIDTVANESKPARLRERIRAVGPTVRPDLARRPTW